MSKMHFSVLNTVFGGNIAVTFFEAAHVNEVNVIPTVAPVLPLSENVIQMYV